VLKRGLTDSAAFWQWLRSTSNRGAKIDRKTVRIIQLDSLGHEKVSWRCLQAYPVKWVGADMKATENSTFVETLELIHCGIVQSGNEASPASPTSLPTITVGVSSVETLSVSVHLGVSL
jgi:phage tail-like protein